MFVSVKKFDSCCQVLLVLCLVVLASCSDDDGPKRTGKEITSFTFSAFSPAVAGTISDQKITVTVPFGTDVTELVPTITISEGASITPKAGVKQDFSKPVHYTVMSEDRATRQYVVTVAPELSFTYTDISTEETAASEQFYIEGTNFHTDDAKVVLNINGTDLHELAATKESTATRLYFNMPSDVSTGVYGVKLVIGDETLTLDETLTVIVRMVVITSISAEKVQMGSAVTVTGQNFAREGNVVYLVDGENYGTRVPVVLESMTSISFNTDIKAGVYRVYVMRPDTMDATSTQTITVE